jgi:hypothetical protein
MEAGDFNFYVRRGYVHVIANVRGSGKSEGLYECLGSGEIQDIYDAIEWLASQPWCDGNVGMFGLSYFGMVQKRVAALNPPHLKALFAMYGFTDIYCPRGRPRGRCFLILFSLSEHPHRVALPEASQPTAIKPFQKQRPLGLIIP